MDERRERLTQLIHAAHMAIADRDDNRDTYTAIADHLIDNGVIVPPVKVGQTVWSIVEGFNHVLEGKIYEYTVRSNGMAYIRFTRNGYFTGIAMDDAIGKTVFLTREAAGAALKARENNAD